MVILIWWFSEFVFIHQIKCMDCLNSYVSMIFLHGMDSLCCQTKYPPVAKLYVPHIWYYDHSNCKCISNVIENPQIYYWHYMEDCSVQYYHH